MKKHGCETAKKKFTNTDKTTLDNANNTITKLTHYGLRKETAPSNGVLLSWSNGARKWTVTRSEVKKGEILSLDANEVFLPVDKRTAERIQLCLSELPLYRNSFEARYGGL